MSDPVDRSKSLREQVEEYKRGQRALEAAKKEAADSEDLDDDLHPADPELGDWTEEEKREFAELERTSREQLAGGPNVVRIVSTVFLGIGVLLLLISAALFSFAKAAIAAEVTAPGVVVNNVLRRAASTPNPSSNRAVSSDYYHAVVEFRVADGTLKTVEMAEGNWPKAYEEGEKVTVRYDPQKPLRARLGGGGPMDFLATIITGSLGAIFTMVAVGLKAFALP